MPPFGRQLYGLRVLLDSSLADKLEFVFEGERIGKRCGMPMDEYLRVERPAIASVAATRSRAASLENELLRTSQHGGQDMRDRIVPSAHPDEELVEPRRAQENEEERRDSDPCDDDVDEDAVPLS